MNMSSTDHPSMDFHIVTLFPAFFAGPFSTGILGRAIDACKIGVQFYHLADFKEERKRVDDIPYGGGPGMVIRPEVAARAIEAAKSSIAALHAHAVHAPQAPHAAHVRKIPVIHFSPRGKPFTQASAERLASHPGPVILLCGRYEGIDQRVIDLHVTHEYRIGDTVVTGGETPALFLIDAVSRLIPGVLGNDASTSEESFSRTLGRRNAEYPCYTRPELWRDRKVPEVLISGNHKNIREWRSANITVRHARKPQKPRKDS
jgi:tRNA (guanine37-N1)-methyltransferase